MHVWPGVIRIWLAIWKSRHELRVRSLSLQSDQIRWIGNWEFKIVWASLKYVLGVTFIHSNFSLTVLGCSLRKCVQVSLSLSGWSSSMCALFTFRVLNVNAYKFYFQGALRERVQLCLEHCPLLLPSHRSSLALLVLSAETFCLKMQKKTWFLHSCIASMLQNVIFTANSQHSTFPTSPQLQIKSHFMILPLLLSSYFQLWYFCRQLMAEEILRGGEVLW